jgi:hypothetical protein
MSGLGVGDPGPIPSVALMARRWAASWIASVLALTRFNARLQFSRSHTSSINCSAMAGLSVPHFPADDSVPSGRPFGASPGLHPYPPPQPQLAGALVRDLLESSLPALEKDLREEQKNLEGTPAASAEPQPTTPTVGYAIQAGMQKYTRIPARILAIYAIPHDRGITDPAARAAADAKDMETAGATAKAFETGLASARVLRLPHASHFVFMSNEADVLREMNAFLGSLP